MSAEHPPHPETGPEAPSTPEPTLEQVAARSTVPPTPEAPRAEIEAVNRSLSARASAAHQPQAAPAAPPSVATQTHPTRFAQALQWTRGVAGGVFGFFHGFFGYILRHMVLQGLMRAGEMNTGGGGGGHAKPKGGGGGGHH